MKEKFIRFMQGRYGVDKLSQFLLGLGIALGILSMFVRRRVIHLLFLALIFLVYYRMFSRNIPKRYAENQKFMVYYNKFFGKIKRQQNLMQQRKDFHIYKCPQCKQKIRIPKGKGKIIVTCPKCRHEFEKRS